MYQEFNFNSDWTQVNTFSVTTLRVLTSNLILFLNGSVFIQRQTIQKQQTEKQYKKVVLQFSLA